MGRIESGETSWASRRAFPRLGLALGAMLAALLGWISVPNPLLYDDTLANHTAVAIAAILAASPWCYRQARRAAETPVRTAVRLSLLTYLSGIVTIAIGALVTAPFREAYTAWTLRDEAVDLIDLPGVLVSAIPWIVAGAFVWCAAMLVLGSTTGTRAQSVLEAARGRRTALRRLGSAAAISALVVSPVFAYVRPSTEPVPDPPSAHRPAIAGIIESSDETSDTVQLTDGRVLSLGSSSALRGGGLQRGFLFLMGEDRTWDASLADYHIGYSSAQGLFDVSDPCDFAWDRDGSVLFSNGLELPKAPDFTSFDQPFQRSSDRLWLPHHCGAYFYLNGRGEVAARILRVYGGLPGLLGQGHQVGRVPTPPPA